MKNNQIPEFVIPAGEPAELGHWAEIIEKSANQLCNDPECKKIKFRIDMNRSVMSAIDYDALHCFIQSFKKNKNKIPPITRKLIHDAVGTCVVKCASILEP
jgi:hypothetical protein